MFRKLTASILVLGLFGGLVSLSVVALFTDTASVGSNTFTTGTVDITTSPVSALITFSNMAPGDKVTNPITVTNAGSLALRYAVSSTADDTDLKGLRAQLDLRVWDEAVEADAGTTCNATPPATLLYGPGDLGSSPAIAIFGSATSGPQAGDRALAAAASEVLCFQAELPLSTGNAYQNATTTATFTFDAEQTANNP